jgi:hypothetical protein
MTKVEIEKSDSKSGNEIKQRIEFPGTNRKRLLIRMVSFFVLIGCIALLFHFFLDLPITYLFFSIYILFLAPFLLIVAVPLIWILIKITFRTRNRDFMLQLFVVIQLTVVCCFIFPISVLFSFERELLTVTYLMLSMSLIILGIVMNFSHKPIFWNSSLDYYSAPLLVHQSAEINGEQDGYSQRPLLVSFQEMEDFISSSAEFRVQLEKYARFLGKKGELIDWDIKDTSVTLYPRFLIRTPNFLWEFRLFYQFLYRLLTRRNLTTIEIIFSAPQISIRVSAEDYDLLSREVTFHLLVESILKCFKESLLAFFNQDFNAAYQNLFPQQ